MPNRYKAWGSEERERLNKLYWELGRPKRAGRDAVNDLLELYAGRHRIRFGDRSVDEVKERVKRMLATNGFKERGESEYWSKMMNKDTKQ
jgi:hypothetical protein